MRHLDLFSGIGGFALAVEMVWPEVEHIFCDNDPFSQAILKKHWPKSPIFSDIKRFNMDVRNAMMSVCEEQMDSALCAEYRKRLADVPTVSHATASESLNGEYKIESVIVQTSESGSSPASTKSFLTTEESASAAEKRNASSSPSTTSLITGTQNEGSTNHRHGNSRSNEGFQTTINSSATTATTLKLITEHVLTKPIELLTGGFPCQPFSSAGRRKGTQDDRHLWPSMLETIRLLRPTYVLGENVGGFLTWSGGLVFEAVCSDLEEAGYEVCPLVIPAVAVNAPHRRDRVWIAAFNPEYARLNGTKIGEGSGAGSDCDTEGTHQDEQPTRPVVPRHDVTDPSNPGLQGSFTKESTGYSGQCSGSGSKERDAWSEDWPSAAARLCALDDGLPDGLARPRGWRNAALKGAGNAIVPAVAAEIMHAIRLAEQV